MSRFRIANLGLGSITQLDVAMNRLQAIRYAEVVLRKGHFVAIYPRWWPRIASHWDAWKDSYLRPLNREECRVYYSFPMGSPDYMAINYVVAGPSTSYSTLMRAMMTINTIATSRNASGIVCQATNSRLTERLMSRWGFEKHALSLGDDHYIKRLK